MPEQKTFYITTTLPYVNSDPHIGFAMEIIQADIIVRWLKLQDHEVFFNTGTDEHGQKVFKAALAAGEEPQAYADTFAKRFQELKALLNLDESLQFIRTTDVEHVAAAQEFWKRCAANGDIEKKTYKTKYCTGCELEKTDSELVDGRCPLHPDRELEIRNEENYFFTFSKYGDRLLKLYENRDFMIPHFRINEMKALIEKGLEDFSISRLKEKMPWGVPVPDDEAHVMYVWFDALVSYISTLGWPDSSQFEKFWTNAHTMQFAGKDQVRQQSAMWQAMLMSAHIKNTDQIIIHGFLNFGGQKMSKSIGNVISPQDVVDEFGVDVLRYFVAREFNQFEDTDISLERLKESYNGNLANGLGNLVSRIMKLAETHLAQPSPNLGEGGHEVRVRSYLENFEIQKAIDIIWHAIGDLDREIQEKKPWESKDKEVIESLVEKLSHIGSSLAPFMPETSEKILNLIKENKAPSEPLFPRKD